jgi:hypothetical protein
LGAGFILRLALAHFTFLNADETYHYFLSAEPSLALTYRASLTTAHPPLLLVFLHYWSRLGNSEILLRLPSVLAGTAFCWLMFLWLKRVFDADIALIGLTLLVFAPPLIWLSAEVRQYALLLFFSAGSLLLLERGLTDQSPRLLLMSALCLCLALLCHYSSFLLAVGLGIYGIVRICTSKRPTAVVVAWVMGQAASLAVALWLLESHVLRVRANGMSRWIADSYLRASVFHPGADKLIPFAVRSNFRFFRYLFAQTRAGDIGLVLFAIGVISLLVHRVPAREPGGPSPTVLALLLTFPFVLNCGLSLAGIYPYGGTRHNSYLAIFAIPGIAIALETWKFSPRWATLAAIMVVLAFCNLFPQPLGEYIELHNQNRQLMSAAVNFLQKSSSPETIILTDEQGYEYLNYYLCGSQPYDFEGRFPKFLEASCPGHRLVVRHQFDFKAQTFAQQFGELESEHRLAPGSKVWLFQAGWYINTASDLRAEFARSGCDTPHEFGQNILICPLAPGSPQ